MTPAPDGDDEPAVRAAVRRQETVAELGRQALETDDLDGLRHDAAAAVADVLEVGSASVFESRPGDGLVLREGVGWDDATLGTATAPGHPGTHLGCALDGGAPIVAGDLREDERVDRSDVVADRDAVAGIAVPIGPAEAPWGVLAAHATDTREYDHRDELFVRNVANVLGTALEHAQTERRFETIFEDPNILVGLLEPDGTVVDVNETAMDYVDTDIEEVRGEPFWETPWWTGEDGVREDVRAWTERAATGEYVAFETDLTRPDGGQYTLEGAFRPVTDDDGEVVSILVSDRDVTERTACERQLEASNERLEQFAYAASHDLQEPLRMVTSYLQLLESRHGDDLEDDALEFVAFAVDGAERMGDMIDALLEYSRVETRGDPLEPVALADVVDDVLANLQFRIEEEDAEITVDALPTVRGDRSQLRQVFQNLLSNALEYSGDAPPRIHVTADRQGETWRVAVSDAGIGIAPDDQERVFEVFQRLHSREEHAGTGIGLALCRRILERHDGEITVDAEPGEGATFSFTLPAAEGADG